MTGFWRRAGAVLAVWFAATVFVLMVAAETKIGPVLLTVSRRHGVHAGDVVAAVATYGVAAALTWWLLVRWREADRVLRAACRRSDVRV